MAIQVDESQTSDQTEDVPVDLVGFNVSEYSQYFPFENTYSQGDWTALAESIAERKYGWKSRARIIKQVADHFENAQSMQGQLSSLLSITYGRKAGTKIQPESAVRTNLRSLLQKLDLENLQEAADKYSVSWDSFMGGEKPDRPSLTEAIIDEMLVGLV